MQRALAVMLATLLTSSALAAPTPVAITAEPTADPSAAVIPGLCARTAISTNPAVDFSVSTATFESSIAALITNQSGSTVSMLVPDGFDFSNSNTGGLMVSRGDFQSAVTGCTAYGCGFFVNDTTTSFGMRIRGFLVVDDTMTGTPVHFGFYADDAVALRLFDGAGASYPVIVRPPQLGFPTWRTTNAVTFTHAGLYPLEISYAEISDHAALELSVLKGSFTDVEAAASASTSLAGAGFTLATNALFVRSEQRYTLASSPSCTECARADVGTTNGCPTGSVCNAAALCDACRSDAHCGGGCVACSGSTPRCIPSGVVFTCAQCVDAADCGPGATCVSGTCMTPPPLDAGLGVDAGGDADVDGSMPTVLRGSGGCACSTATRPRSGDALGWLVALTLVCARALRGRGRAKVR